MKRIGLDEKSKIERSKSFLCMGMIEERRQRKSRANKVWV